MRLTRRMRVLLAVTWAFVVLGTLGYLAQRITTRASVLAVAREAKRTCKPNPRAFVDDGRLHHTLPPCAVFVDREMVADGGLEDLEYEILVRVNSLGFRNQEYTLEKPPTTTRVVILGDSFGYGLGLPLERTFYKLLEKKLQAQTSRQVEVWSVSVVSWSTLVQANLAEDHLAEMAPDVVLLLFDDSDFYDNAAYREELAGRERFTPDPAGMDGHWRRRERWISHVRGTDGGDAGPAAIDDVQDLAAAQILRIHRVAQRLGKPFTVVTYPYPEFPPEWETDWMARLYARLRPAGVPVLSLFDAFPMESRREDYFPRNRHWNERGSEVAAERLYIHLTRAHPALFPR
ncbi:MAG: hypothetical protein U0263_10925 [Polyangiaceae bacterium]